jgi:hypothetical protein
MKTLATVFILTAMAFYVGAIITGVDHGYGVGTACIIIALLFFQGASQNHNKIRRRK